ncbi:STY0301 family protein [Azospirillum sp. Sh1]|uniref:STY0301 family protein n=1 Tax=Azospirillum sp. Sh1 TaxID=2607285 RepID=UPI0011EF0AFC|nr:STY0301 family protein [Azospirillum sp. Sh1]KAA0577553.1 hypothetical protein FZ029_10350 [Azospirillum sp. Sh1]
MIRRALIGLAAAAASPTASSNAADLSCPTEIGDSLSPYLVMKGRLPVGAALTETVVINGHPNDELAEFPITLVPSKETRKKDRVTTTWLFNSEEISDGVMVICRYNDPSGYLLFMLPSGTKSCTARFQKSRSDVTLSGMQCG